MRPHNTQSRTWRQARLVMSVLATGCCGQAPLNFAVEVEVADSRTGVPPSTEVVMVITDDVYYDTVRVSPPWDTPALVIPGA